MAAKDQAFTTHDIVIVYHVYIDYVCIQTAPHHN